MNKKTRIIKFIWIITYSHVIAYFVAGIFALVFMNYKELYAADTISLLMRPVTDPIVALGPALQIFRGIILALAVYPMRRLVFEEKYGYLKLGWIILVFSLISTIGPTTGSFDGYIYTIIPAGLQVLGYPEALVYILLFLGILKISNRFEGRKLTLILPAVFVALIVFMGVMGYYAAVG